MVRFYLIAWLLLCGVGISAASPISFNTDEEEVWIGQSLQYLIDPSFTLTLDEVKQSQNWKRNTSKSINFRDADFAVWLKAEINNENSDAFLEFQYPIIDTIECFIFQEGQLVKRNTFGSHFPFDKRELELSLPTIKIPKGNNTIYIKATSQLNLQLPLVVYSEKQLYTDNTRRDFAQGLYTGILVLAILSALFIGIFAKDVIFYAYIGHVIGTGFITLHIGGYAFQYIWPNFPAFNIYEPWIFGLGIFSTLFSMAFLDTANRSKSLNRWLWVSLIANFLVFPLAFLGYIELANQLVQIVGMLGCALMLIVGIIFLKRGFKEARFFVLAWSFFLVGVIITILERVSVLPFNTFTLHASQIGSGLDVILLSVALADRINILREEKNKAQRKALDASEQNRRLIENQNSLLAEKVRERTKELEELNAQKTRLFSIIGHDLRGPVGTMKQALEILVSNPETRTTEMLEGLKESSASSFNLLENLLIWSRSNLNEIEIEKERVQINTLIEDVLGLVKLSAQAKNIEIESDFSPTVIQTDQRLLAAIVRNILANAIKFTPSGGKVGISTQRESDEWLLLKFKDTGIGMDQSTIDQILNRAYNTSINRDGTSGEKGTGLGLRLSIDFCEKLGGSMEIQSQPGEGTTIFVRVPSL